MPIFTDQTPVDDNFDAYNKGRYLADVRDWAMYMLEVLRGKPSTAEKLTLLQQVDRIKSQSELDERSLPAYAATLAYLSLKAAKLLQGKEAPTPVTKEAAIEALKSGALRRRFARSEEQFDRMREMLKLRRISSGSETLRRLSETGH